jgi:glutamate dehydrogenase (NAD(P)+)
LPDASRKKPSMYLCAFHANDKRKCAMSPTKESDPHSKENPFKTAQRQLDEAAALMELDHAAHELLRWPLRELHVTLPVKMDNGTTQIFHGFRVQHNDARGPNKGGIRFHPDETIDTVRALAAWMTWKTALMDIPLGGGKGGIICNPKNMSAGELERLSRAYIRQLGSFLGPKKDIPAPDMYTSPQVMAWMLDEYSIMQGQNEFGVITGKPLALGGSAGRGDATARGGIICVREAAAALGLNSKGSTAAIQGYGNAGSFAHKLGAELLGMKVVAVSDSKGGIYNPNGFAYEHAVAHKKQTGSVTGFPEAEDISNDALLELDVDVLFPSALEEVITERNAQKIKAKIIAELANGATTPEADAILYSNGITLIPDLLCNAGGVTVSYFEMVQNASGYYWAEEEVHRRLEKKMKTAFYSMQQTAQTRNMHNRMAAYIVAVGRVTEAMKLRGWY